MIAPNNIYPPKNWQDFEMLCLKLWGELWNIPNEIDFNSDNAQGQQGVDIYGPVEGGLKYNGIQCKNKKLNLIDGSPNRITIADIQTEIDKAKEFKPALNKLIIATSLPKDQKIEEYARLQSVENVQQGLFTIQVCFWDFFERKLPEFQKVYDWYLKNENFHRVSSAEVVFSGGSTANTYQPKFQRIIDRYTFKEIKEDNRDPLTRLQSGDIDTDTYLNLSLSRQLSAMRQFNFHEKKYDWKQNFWFKLSIRNSGQSVIEDFKLELDFEGDFIKVGAESRSGLEAQYFSTDVHEYSNTERSLYIKPKEKIIVQGDSYTTGSIFLKPTLAVKSEVTLYWKLLARDFEDSGKLIIKIEPRYYTVLNKHDVETIGEEKEEISYGLIQRPGNFNIMGGGVYFTDKDSNYTFD
ncbi:hypothetical protein MTO98_30320 [Mucilaginibacter sp. SMC90]|uniref:hypothetical protein n=1 Tax=Mucilaginibacter sp. SMC90 TaxID=2929803 RepID=UPI001FB1AC8C|nr:hypothetical protein [Mucilaginibacter sp. SMC90]UOE48698.1 hypothetical protein MTO98_30320 [Mucilaginibacter sp. SMC90]